MRVEQMEQIINYRDIPTDKRTVSYTHLDVYKRQVQSISLSLMCRWFRVAVLPLDGELSAALLYRGSRKRCAVCGAAFVPKSNRGKYCPDCAGRMKKIRAAEVKNEIGFLTRPFTPFPDDEGVPVDDYAA